MKSSFAGNYCYLKIQGNEDYYVNGTELCTSHEIKLYPSQKHANHLFHTPDTSLSPSSLNIHRLQLHDQLLQQLTLS